MIVMEMITTTEISERRNVVGAEVEADQRKSPVETKTDDDPDHGKIKYI